MLTTIQLRAQTEQALHQKLKLRMYETVVKVNLTDDKITVLTEGFVVEHLARETRYKARYQRMIEYKRYPWVNHPGLFLWRESNQLRIQDPDFQPIAEATHRRILTPIEWHDKRNYEASCFRPGTPDFPMDNYDRTMIEPAHPTQKSTAKMERHWSK